MNKALTIHDSAAATLLAAAEAVPPAGWHEPLADGKWSPAQILAHLIAAHDILLSELRGGAGMRILTRWWQQLLLRIVLVPRLLAGGAFPKNARAPKETRPGGTLLEQDAAIALFRERAKELHDAARNAEPSKRISHAYFGKASVANGVTLCARHIQHHTAQLPRSS